MREVDPEAASGTLMPGNVELTVAGIGVVGEAALVHAYPKEKDDSRSPFVYGPSRCGTKPHTLPRESVVTLSSGS